MEDTNGIEIISGFELYVTTWGIYNAGGFGFYVDLADYADHEEFMADLTEKLKNHRHKDHDPEWQFQDVSGLPDSLVNEDRVSPMVFDWILLTDEERDLLTAWVDAIGADLTDITSDLSTAQNDLQGKFDSDRDGWEELADELLNYDEIKIPSWVVIDYEATWKANLRHDFSTSDHNGDFWVFSNR